MKRKTTRDCNCTIAFIGCCNGQNVVEERGGNVSKYGHEGNTRSYEQRSAKVVGANKDCR